MSKAKSKVPRKMPKKEKKAEGRTFRVGYKHVLAVACCVLAVVAAVMTYRPMPDGIQQPWRARQYIGLLRFLSLLAAGGEVFGFGNFFQNSRRIIDVLSTFPFVQDHGGITVEDTHFDGVKVRLYKPLNMEPNSPAVVYIHGGGWVICSVESHDIVTSHLARKLNSMVVSIDYRLSPEHPYPVPLEDSLDATLYFMQHAAEYGVDNKRIAVIGDSAGGNLGASIAMKLRGLQPRYPQFKIQALMYPVLQGVDLNLPAYANNDGVALGTKSDTATILLAYLGHHLAHTPTLLANNHTTKKVRQEFKKLCHKFLPNTPIMEHPDMQDKPWINVHTEVTRKGIAERLESVLLDPFCFPLMMKNLTGLPTTYIATSEYDLVRDDGMLFAKRLEEAGVPITYKNYLDGFHGVLTFFGIPLGLDVSDRMMNDLTEFLEKTL